MRGILVALMLLLAPGASSADDILPPPIGPETPRVAPIEEQGFYRQSWFSLSFLDLREDFAEAKAAGLRFAVIFEQRGCPYCAKLHTEVLSQKYINDYVRQNFRVIQLDLWGSREVTDFDGKHMSEKALAERWGVIFTPTIVFFKDDLGGLEGKWGRGLEAVERLPLSYGRDTFYDLFVWVRHKIYQRDPNFQRFHIERIAERAALAATRDEPAPSSGQHFE
ncbi:MAG TPA: thioredoxin fold domain-containing protein [Hyphomicrobiaceae bacterium]|nr:thioredoxin fold domain-containing protein [Hyphomicrobiaceae bacterium]